jgi:excisionase family DNA binding protein
MVSRPTENNLEKPVWLPVSTACFVIGIGRTKLYELLGNGTLKSITVGKRRLISLRSIEELGSEGA